MRRSLIVGTMLLLSPIPSHAWDTKDDRIAALEKEIAFLHSELERVHLENKTLRDQLTGIRGILGMPAGPGGAAQQTAQQRETKDCFDRLRTIRRTLEEVAGRGLTAEHPDIRKLSGKEAMVAAECNALVEAYSR